MRPVVSSFILRRLAIKELIASVATDAVSGSAHPESLGDTVFNALDAIARFRVSIALMVAPL